MIEYYMFEKIIEELTVQLGLKTKTIEKIEKTDFKIPIEYLDENQRYELRENVCEDLELIQKEDVPSLYEYLLEPKNEFSKKTVPKWKTYITTNTDFLKETQQVIKELDVYKTETYVPDHDSIMEIWKDTQQDAYFMEKYSYIEFPMFEYLNRTPFFLQSISIINMSSPILSFIMPFLLFLVPFLILKIQGISISLSVYMDVLKSIGRQHFIGQLITSAENLSVKNMIYIICLIGLYAYQIYNNYLSCIRFYTNIARMNKQICTMQEYLDYMITRMETFSLITKPLVHYSLFRKELLYNIDSLKCLKTTLSQVCIFQPSFSKINEIGMILKCYYEIHSNTKYVNALDYSFHFEGYLSNLLGVFENLQTETISFADFYSISDEKTPLCIEEQYYPALMNEDYVTNDANVSKNMIITGPNAAGKTTFLKTTILNIIFTQQFGCGFYKTCKIKPYTHIHSYLNIPDTSARDSLFQAESRRCKEILNEIAESTKESRHFGIFDELYSGTNPIEASKSAYAFLIYLSNIENMDFMLTTHYVDICEHLSKNSHRIENWKMDATMDEENNIQYQYSISKGLSKIQGAIKVLTDMDYPQEIIDTFKNYETIIKKKRTRKS
jgi:hypothetical protein